MADEPDPVFLDRRERYAADYSKTVIPYYDMSLKFVGLCVEYGKLTVSYLFLINSGGLAGILALYPVVEKANQVWLAQAVWPAILFGLGLVAATITAGAAYLNFTHNGKAFLARGMDDDNWLKLWHFGVHRETTEEYGKRNKATMDKAMRLSTVTTRIAIFFGASSILCAVAGGLLLIGSLLP